MKLQVDIPEHVSPAGDRYLTIPLGSVRARMSDPPMVIAWTMVNGWTPLIPLWLEYQLAHGIEEIYIYNNVSIISCLQLRIRRTTMMPNKH